MRITFIKDAVLNETNYKEGQSLNVSKSNFNRLVNSKVPVAKEYSKETIEPEATRIKVDKTKGEEDGK